jgi:hypothetical protein
VEDGSSRLIVLVKVDALDCEVGNAGFTPHVPSPGSVPESVSFIQEASNETNTTKKIECNFPPKPLWFFSAVDPAIETNPHFACAGEHHSRGN